MIADASLIADLFLGAGYPLKVDQEGPAPSDARRRWSLSDRGVQPYRLIHVLAGIVLMIEYLRTTGPGRIEREPVAIRPQESGQGTWRRGDPES